MPPIRNETILATSFHNPCRLISTLVLTDQTKPKFSLYTPSQAWSTSREIWEALTRLPTSAFFGQEQQSNYPCMLGIFSPLPQRKTMKLICSVCSLYSCKAGQLFVAQQS